MLTVLTLKMLPNLVNTGATSAKQLLTATSRNTKSTAGLCGSTKSAYASIATAMGGADDDDIGGARPPHDYDRRGMTARLSDTRPCPRRGLSREEASMYVG